MVVDPAALGLSDLNGFDEKIADRVDDQQHVHRGGLTVEVAVVGFVAVHGPAILIQMMGMA